MSEKSSAVRLWLRRLAFLVRKEMLATLKDPATRAILIVPIIVQSLLFGYVATFNLERVPYVCLDQSRSRESAEFLALLDGSGIFKRRANLDSAAQIAPYIDSGEAIAAVVIGRRFASDLARGGQVKIQVITDGRNTMTSAAASGYIGRIAEEFNSRLTGRPPLVSLRTYAWFNPNLITRWNFLPGLAGLLSLVQVMMLAGLSVAREREKGTFDQLLVTPLSPALILIGKAAPPFMIGLLQSCLVLGVCRFWFGIPMAGSFLPIFVSLVIFILSCVGIGLSVSAVSESMQQVMVGCFVLLVPMVLLSGLATPVRNMPRALQLLTYADPLRFVLECVRRSYLEGCGVGDIAHNFVPMLCVAAATMPSAAWLFRHKLI